MNFFFLWYLKSSFWFHFGPLSNKKIQNNIHPPNKWFQLILRLYDHVTSVKISKILHAIIFCKKLISDPFRATFGPKTPNQDFSQKSHLSKSELLFYCNLCKKPEKVWMSIFHKKLEKPHFGINWAPFGYLVLMLLYLHVKN